MAKYPISDAAKSDDRLALGVQNGMQVAASPAGALPNFTLPDTTPISEINAGAEYARQGLLASDVNPAEFEPGFMQSLGAYFRSENTVGSAVSSKTFGEQISPTPDSPPVSTDDVIRLLERARLSQNMHLFDEVSTVAQYEARKADVVRQQEDQRIMQATSGLSGTAMMLAAGIIDLPTLLPGTLGVKLGARGVTAGRAFAGTAAAGAVDAAVTETALQGTQVDRSLAESAAAVGGSVVMGGILGTGLHSLARRSMGDSLTRVEDNMKDVIDDLANGAPKSRAANAASLDAYDELSRSGLDGMKPASSAGMFPALEALGKIPGFLGKNMRIPMLDLNQSLSKSALDARGQSIFLPFLQKGEIEVSGPTIQALLRDNRDLVNDVAMTFNTEYRASKAAFKGPDDFDKQVTFNLLDPNTPAHPAVQKVAAKHREVYTKILDQLIEAKVLPPSVKAKYGQTYVPMVFDAMAIKGREAEFRSLISDGFQRGYREEAEAALRLSIARRTQNEEARDRILGRTKKEAVGPAGFRGKLSLNYGLNNKTDADALAAGKFAFKAPGDVPGAQRYDSNSFGNDAVYLDSSGKWTADGGADVFNEPYFKGVAKVDANFDNALVVSAKNLDEIKDKIGGDGPVSGEQLAAYAKKNGYDGIVVTKDAEDRFTALSDELSTKTVNDLKPDELAALKELAKTDPRAQALVDNPARPVGGRGPEIAERVTGYRVHSLQEQVAAFDVKKLAVTGTADDFDFKTDVSGNAKAKRRTVVVVEGALQRRQQVTKEQYDLEVDRVKENRALAEQTFDEQRRVAELQLDNVHDRLAFELHKQTTAEAENIFKRTAGKSKEDVAAKFGKAIEDANALDVEMRKGLKDVEKIYDDYIADLKDEAKTALRRIERSDLTSRERTTALSTLTRETIRRTSAIEHERRVEVGKLAEKWASTKTELVKQAGEEAKKLDLASSKAAQSLNNLFERELANIEKGRISAKDDLKAKTRKDKKELLKPFDDELADAKKIRDDNLADANTKSQKAFADAKAPLREGLEDGLKYTRDGAIDDDLIRTSANELAERWYKKSTGNSRYTAEHEMDGHADFLKKRRTPVPHSLLLERGFVNGQSFSLLEDYVRMAGFDAARASVMKKSVKPRDADGKVLKDSDLIEIGDLKGTQLAADIEGDYDKLAKDLFSSPEYKAAEDKVVAKYAKLVAKAPDEDAKKALYDQAQAEMDAVKAAVETRLFNQRDRDIENMDAIFGALRGGNSAGWSASGIRAAEAVSTLNYVRLMGGTVLSSMTDPIKIAISTGMGNMVKGAILSYHQATNKAWDKASAAEKGISRAAAWSLELNMQSRIASMADIGNPLRFEDTTSHFMRKSAEIFSRASGITYWNAFWKQTSENATSAYLGQLAYKGFDKLDRSERRWLNSLRINGDGLDLIRKAHEGQPNSKFHDDWPLLDHEKWNDAEASRLVRHALGEEINNQVVSPQATDRMLFSTSPGGRLIMQFRQHMISNQMRFIGRQLQLVDGDAHKAAAAGVGLVGLVTAGALVDYMKQVVGQVSPTGNIDRSKSATERHIEEWTKTPGLALYNAMDRSDALPIVLMEPSNVLDKLGWWGPKKAVTAFDDPTKAKEASRFKGRSLPDAIGGPTIGLANDVLKGVPAALKLMTGQKVQRGDYRSAERLIPGQNIPYVQMLTNSFEKYVGDVHSWPNPK